MKEKLLSLLFLFTFLYSSAQLSGTVSSTVNTRCNGSACSYSGPSILINEVMVSPSVNDGSICGAGGSGSGRGEWIELYNPNLCQSVDISCFYLGNNTGEGTGGYVIPSGTIVPAGGFCIIRGANMTAVPAGLLVANGGNVVELIVPTNTTPASNGVCTSGTRIWFPNAGGWMAFYDSNGVPQDAISWNASDPAVAGHLAGNPCVASRPGCTPVSSLSSYTGIPAARKNLVYTTVVPNAWGRSLGRSPDGGNWTLAGIVSPTYGTCNSTCIPPVASTCTGTATANPTGGTSPYTYSWNDPSAQTTQTATGLCAGTYTVTVTDFVGATTTLSVVVSNNVPVVTATNTGPVCSASPSFNVSETGGNVSSWSWSASGGATFTSSTSQTTGVSNATNGEIFTVTGTDNFGCVGSGTTTVTIQQTPTVNNLNLNTCETTLGSGSASGINLTANNTAISTTGSVTFNWFTNPALTSPVADPTNTTVNNGDVFYVQVTNASCSAVATVSYNVTSTIALTNPAPSLCEDVQGSAQVSNYNLTSLNTSVYSGGAGTTYTWYLPDMVTPVPTPSNVTITSASSYYLTVTDGNCSNNVTVTFNVNALPSVTPLADVSSCDSYTLPVIANGNYFTQSGGTGTALAPGNTISSDQQVYIYAQSGGTPNCVNEDVFSIDIIQSPVADASSPVSVCDSYILPALSIGNSYFTGSGGTGNQLSAGTNITTNQMLYIYAQTGTTPNCTDENSFTITIQSGPSLNNPGPQVACDIYTLPSITGTNLSGSQAYYTGPNGTGATLGVGTIVTSDQSVYIYDNNGTCADNETFTVTINTTPNLNNPGPQTECGTYTLPTITGSNMSGSQAYFDDSQVNGGNPISGAISTSQTIWIYDADGACADEESFQVTINPLPTVTDFNGGSNYCVGDVVGNVTVAVTGTASWTISYTLDGNPQIVTGSTSPINLGNSEGVYVINSIADANCNNAGSLGTQTIIINPLPAAPSAGTDSIYCSTSELVNMVASGSGGIYTWYGDVALTNVIGNGATLLPIDQNGTTTYYVTESVNGCEGPASIVTITINDCDIIVPTAFTPDGDNTNDFWQLGAIDEIYPDNLVTVYNRWGGLIYQSERGKYSDKPWDGTYNGKPLPVASYYFIIDFNNEEFPPLKGIVSIVLDK
jgi:gliding motility-associated-like protein